MTTLHVNHISQHFGKHQVLKDVTMTLEPQKIYGLLGRNGAGKSTLLNIITNRIFPSSGDVMLDNTEVFENDDCLSKMYLMSEANLYAERLKVRKIFDLVQMSYGQFDWPLAHELAGKFQVNLEERFGRLSTGYHSIVKLIIALCVPADYIFLDEPVLGLDANHRELFYQELLAAYEKRPRTFVISTHLIEEIANLVEHVFMIDDGQLLADEDVEELIARSYAITGPRPAVLAYTEGLNVVGEESLGQITTNYVFGTLDDTRIIPDSVTIEHLDLQKLFVYLTNGRHQQNEH
ncbi:ABC transporter, ATP-binding protein [Paucilactobacillus vaccinostercus DSM 20634]|jgi:ABC-2 type transport system ATP-binding protein|uniref:ABC transporter, ATP-binding protein n=1 Tax=Paucilactobacillus vaccinostercus DSM 20634 TaxID=1423813 RepID=A0A0R2A1R1_9LACO|nr:ABC transporter ATP-binding protein [Paucilactobacillus vaccinostercus]KRM60575.1 ABC transporter, ATP-binding protein [Paucilactobacillus vaccinostercus DSM 20634]RRG09062.1 MAG: ABC transporter ATP-binding protein [Lactobacillus sp.]